MSGPAWRSLFWDCQPASPARRQGPPQYCYRRTVQKKLHLVHQLQEIRVQAVKHGQTRWHPKSRKTQRKIRTPFRALRNPLRDLPEWLDDSTEILVDERIPLRDAPANSSRESETAALKEVVLGEHNIYNHIPKYGNCEIRTRTKISRVPCRKRTWKAISRAEKFW